MIEEERDGIEEEVGEHPDFSDDELSLLEELMLEQPADEEE